MLKLVLFRILFGLEVGILLSIPFNEFAFQKQGGTITRLPTTIDLTIPTGTAETVALGTDVLPENLDFVQGDRLVVQNQDSVVHTLGPMVIPADNTAEMKLQEIGQISYYCTFAENDYLGLLVRPAISWADRLEWIILGGIPFGLVLGLVSLKVKPVKRS
jgi:hypothetical protein